MAASHPEDRSEENENYLHSYVHCTKVAQQLETILVKMIMDVDHVPGSVEDVFLAHPHNTLATDSDVKHGSGLDSDRDSSESGSDVVSESDSDSDSSCDPHSDRDEVTLDSGSDGVTSESGSDGAASESGGDEVSAVGAVEQPCSKDHASERVYDKAAVSDFLIAIGHLTYYNKAEQGTSIDDPTRQTVPLRCLHKLRLLTLENTHVQFRLVRARLEASLLEKEIELGHKRISDVCGDNELSERDPLRTWLIPCLQSQWESRSRENHSIPRHITTMITGKKHRHHSGSVYLPSDQLPKKKQMEAKPRSQSF
jgi:hypothetical protein